MKTLQEYQKEFHLEDQEMKEFEDFMNDKMDFYVPLRYRDSKRGGVSFVKDNDGELLMVTMHIFIDLF